MKIRDLKAENNLKVNILAALFATNAFFSASKNGGYENEE
jgi:hypothetical protein